MKVSPHTALHIRIMGTKDNEDGSSIRLINPKPRCNQESENEGNGFQWGMGHESWVMGKDEG